MPNKKFKRQLLASSIAMLVTASVNAQNNNPAVVEEEIIVTGIRGSLIRAMDVKRDAQGVVDAISAEDIGKFPDTNLAESLQRITGVSIDRSNGEGSKVTVRGLGPEFNLVTLNGRQMPGATIEATVASGSRSFDFANIASEGVSGVEVFKTVRAANTPGGIGATINIKTAKPLDTPGLKASIGGKGVFDQSREDGSVTPEISGIYSQTFADDKFGVAISASYQEREGGTNVAQVGTGWRSFPGTVTQDWSTPGAAEWGGIDANPDSHVNRPEPEDIYSVPQQIGYSFEEFERKRTNGQLVLQYEPIETVRATLDYTYSENDVTTKYNDMGAWFNFGGQRTVWTDNGTGAVETPLIYSEVEQGGADLTFGAGENSQRNVNKSLGLNFEWQATDQLTIELDYHDSEAKAAPDNEYGNNAGIAVSAFVRETTTADFNQDFPAMILDIVDGAGGSSLRTEDLQVSGSFFNSSQMTHEIEQIQLSGTFDFNDKSSINFGVALTDQENVSTYSNVQRDTWGGLGSPGDIPAEFFSLESVRDRFEAPGSGNAALQNQRWSYNFEDLRNFAAENYGEAADSDCGNFYCSSSDPSTVNQVDEESMSAYFQYNLETQIGGMTTRLSAGIRYEDTEVTAPALEQSYEDSVRWVAANEFSLVPLGDPVEISDSGSYDYFLPSIDVSLDVTEDIVVRASAGRSLARAAWDQLKGGLSLDQGVRVDGGTGSRGNPGLLPIISDNLDLSVEWYFQESSYASIGYYRKDVENFIGEQVVTESPLSGAYHPALGPRYQAAIDSGIAIGDNPAIRQYIIDNTAAGDPSVEFPDGQDPIILGIAGEDGISTFDITETVNEKDVQYTGWEFAVQHVFGDSGFGGIANYTIVDSDVEFDNLLINEPQFAVTGQSDSANLIGFYDKDGIQVRLTYNWRDEFLASTASGTGNNPIYVDAYSQWDINASYEVMEGFTVFVEGINITEEYSRNRGRSSKQTLGVFEGGARYNVGARYTF